MMRDVVVVGGGPAGLMTARQLATEGHDVLVLEEHPHIGVPTHCTGLLGLDAFSELDLPRHTILDSTQAARFVDVDNDGLRDIFVAQSHVLDTIEKTNNNLKYRQPPLLMRNVGGRFVNISTSAGPIFSVPFSGRGAAFGDLDNDGDTDVVLAQVDGPAVILRNDGTKNHWLGISLIGAKSNHQGLGARIIVTAADGRKQTFEVSTASSYLSSNDPRIIVGLGKSNAISVEVRWPSGKKQTITNPEIDRYLIVKEI